MTPYGQYEDSLTYAYPGFKAVRFDPPYRPPYRIVKLRFPSVAREGGAALFPSIRLVSFDTSSRQLVWDSPLLAISQYAGSADGVNEIPTDIAVTDPGRVFFLCFEFPTAGQSQFPYLRTDIRDMERGFFDTSYSLDALHRPIPYLDRNIVATMVCELSVGDDLAAPDNMGLNWHDLDHFDFQFRFIHRERHRVVRVNLLRQDGPVGAWRVSRSAAADSTDVISFPGPLFGGPFWALQAIDGAGNSSSPSNVIFTNVNQMDGYEPNGSMETASTPPSGVLGSATIYPPGDRDFFTVSARPGESIYLRAETRMPASGSNDLDLIALLYDDRGKLVASDDNSYGGLNPSLTYRVRGRLGGDPQRFTAVFADAHGSRFSPGTVPSLLDPDALKIPYVFAIVVTPGAAKGTQRLDASPIAYRVAPTGVVLNFRVPTEAVGHSATVRLFDVRGRLVRTLADSPGSAERSVTWDSRDGKGLRVGSGVYYAVVDITGSRTARKIVLTR